MKKPFFSRMDRAAFLFGAVVSFLVYFFTCAPSVTMEDSGELAVAGDYLGVPHPPGYPTWTVAAWVFSRLLSWIGFRGQPSPAWAIAVMSAFWGALSIGIMAMLVSRTSRDLLSVRRAEQDGDGISDDGSLDRIGFLAGVSSALVFAFTPVMWSQCTIVEVYSFGAFFLMLTVLLTYRWMRRPSTRLLVLTAFVFGLGLTNYQVLLLAIVPLVLVILLQDVGLFRDFCLFVIPFALVCGVLKLGAEYNQPGFPKFPPLHPDDPTGGALRFPEEAFLSSYTLYALLIVFALVFVASALVLGLRARGKLPRFLLADSVRPVAHLALVVSALALFFLSVGAPTATDPWAGRVPADQVFRWTLPTLGLIAGLAALWVFALFTPSGLWYAAACTGIVFPLAVLIRKGAILGLTHPLSGFFAVYVLINFLLVGLTWLLLENGRTVALTVLAGEAGVAFYGLMPLLGDSCPPMNWGFPRTWEGFKHAITRGQYEKIAPTAMFDADFIRKLGSYFSDVRMQFTLVLAPLGFLPFAAWRLRTKKRTMDLLPGAIACVAAIAAIVALDKVSAIVDFTRFRIDKIGFLALLLATVVGLHLLFARQVVPLLRGAFDPARDRSLRLVGGLAGAGIALALAVAVLGFAKAVAEFLLESANILPLAPSGEPSARFLLLSRSLTALFFASWAAAVGSIGTRIWRGDAPVETTLPVEGERWHLVTFVNFVMMSIILIALANPRGDVQDAFIQKVKFISSHGLFALWIGYGVAYGLFFFRANRSLQFALGALACLTPLIPLCENYRNFHMTDITSAAEQNGHDFGWQFGNYQLRGAEAITEELSDEEEPLPNPLYPPAMSPDAVFFGGTDAGRFVPTYMIYSALVRPDVFLITQNALADNTYLDTMRVITRYPGTDRESVYANDLWMPTIDDNRVAFTTYARDVKAGRRPDLGGISEDSEGRVSVNGALSVMEINGLIAEQIFLHNRDRHDFYVEESYAIQWMYPHLSPHGLIMKINRDPAPIASANAVADMEFWDWYSRRLLATPAFARDLPARKGFSKLRAAIAGAYVRHRDVRRAERAYQEALSLYVYSPEAAMRLSQEVLLPQGRYDAAVTLLERLQTIDPNNTRIPLPEIRAYRDADRLVDELLPRFRRTEPPMPEADILRLVEAALGCGRTAVAVNAINDSARRADLTSGFFLRSGELLYLHGYRGEASRLFGLLRPERGLSPDRLRMIADSHMEARDWAKAAAALSVLLRANANDCESWIRLAVCHHAQGASTKATTALREAFRLDRDATIALLSAKYPFLIERPTGN